MKGIFINLLTLLSIISTCAYYINIGGVFSENDSEVRRAFENAIAIRSQKGELYKAVTKTALKNDIYMATKIICNMTSSEHGIAAIFGPNSIKTNPIAQSISTNLEIPNIQINWMPTMSSNSLTVLNFFPQNDLYVKGLGVIIKNFAWKSFVVLYENDESLIRVQNILKIQNLEENKKLITITVKQLGSGPDYRSTLKEVKNVSEPYVILDCETDHIVPFLTQAKEIGILDNFHTFFLTSIDAHTLDFSVIGKMETSILTVRITDPDNPELISAVNNWNQQERYTLGYTEIHPEQVKAETALMHDAIRLFLKAAKRLNYTKQIHSESLDCDRLDKWKDGLLIVEYMKLLELKESVTGPIKFDTAGKRIDFILNVLEMKNGRFQTRASWQPSMGETINYTRTDLQQNEMLEEDLQKYPLIVTSRIGPPYLQDRVPEPGKPPLTGNDRYEGYSMDLITEIANLLNFSFIFQLAKDKKYGKYDPKTKQWDGLIKDVLDQKAHLAICDLTITHERREVVDFSLPFMTLGITIIYKKATKEPANMFAFMDPFSFDVWIYTATLYLAISIMLYFIARMAPGDWENPHPCDQNPEELENIWNLKNCMWLTLGSIMTQGCDILPKGISSRMATSMWWFFSLIMTSSYTANLSAFLTLDKMGPTIDSAEALARQTKIKYGTVEDGATQAFFRESNFSTYQRMWTQMVSEKPSVFEKSNAEGVKRVKTTKKQLYAFIMESSSVDYEIERNCDLKQVGTWLDSKGYGIGMPMNFKYRSLINGAILKLSEEGKLRELKTRWWKDKNPKQPCDQPPETKNSGKLALEKVGGVFLVLGVGIVIALLLAIVEFLWNVRNISVEEHMSYWETLKIEFKFAINIWEMKKRTKPQLSESSSSKSNFAETRSIVQGASSFLNLNVLNRIGMIEGDKQSRE